MVSSLSFGQLMSFLHSKWQLEEVKEEEKMMDLSDCQLRLYHTYTEELSTAQSKASTDSGRHTSCPLQPPESETEQKDSTLPRDSNTAEADNMCISNVSGISSDDTVDQSLCTGTVCDSVEKRERGTEVSACMTRRESNTVDLGAESAMARTGVARESCPDRGIQLVECSSQCTLGTVHKKVGCSDVILNYHNFGRTEIFIAIPPL